VIARAAVNGGMSPNEAHVTGQVRLPAAVVVTGLTGLTTRSSGA
jgi:hypothetical protein